MEGFWRRHQGRHHGSITGFDRIWFRGIVPSIGYVEGLNSFMGNPRVPFKGCKGFVEKFSAGVRQRAEEIAGKAGRPMPVIWKPWRWWVTSGLPTAFLPRSVSL